MILVVGATGTNGREVATRLAAAGQQIRALVQRPDKAANLLGPDVELVQGDLNDPASLEAALKGVDKAFIVAAVDQRATIWYRNFFEAAKTVGTGHIVKFSAMGAGSGNAELLRQHGDSDQFLQASGLAYTILRPNSFYQNLLWSAGTIKEQGAFYLPIGDAKQSLVDVRDIAAVAVAVLTGKDHEGKIYEITGPESLSYYDVAEKLSKVLGKPIKYVDVSPATAKEGMLKAGTPEWNAIAVTELYGVFATGLASRTMDTVSKITGKRPISFEQFVRDFAGQFR